MHATAISKCSMIGVHGQRVFGACAFADMNETWSWMLVNFLARREGRARVIKHLLSRVLMAYEALKKDLAQPKIS